MNECQQFDTVNLFKLHFSSAVAHFVLQRDVFGTCIIGSIGKIAFASFWLVIFSTLFFCRNRKIHRKKTIGKTLKVGRMSVLHANSFWNQCCSISCVINILDLSTLNLAKKKCCYQNKSAFFHRNALQSQWTLDVYSMYGVDYTAKSFYDRPVYMCAFNSHFFFPACIRPIKNSLTHKFKFFNWFQSLSCINVSVKKM